MAKLFVFGIGGTGSRVIKALAMLLASGVKLGNDIDIVVPIMIDPDASNGDLTRTVDILKKYQNIRSKTNGSKHFFNVEIKTLSDLGANEDPSLTNNFKFLIPEAKGKFGEFIDYFNLNESDKAFVDLLFSSKNIEANMTVGFKGNPNIGSVVLNKFRDSPEYAAFMNHFNEGDSIFIISSIFGGTGAAGFPLLLKNLRDIQPGVQNSERIGRSKIGAISYMPYFKVQRDIQQEQEIDSATFIGKTKAALHYYEHAILSGGSLDAFYSLGNRSDTELPYAEGEIKQRNRAHFLELAGALAIVDYTLILDDLDRSETIFKEFGIRNEVNKEVRFKSLGDKTEDQLMKALSKFQLLSLFLSKSNTVLQDSRGEFFTGNDGVDHSFYKSNFYDRQLKPFIKHFDEWIAELAHESCDPKFSPFHFNQEHNNLLEFIKDIEISGGFLRKKQVSGDEIIRAADLVVKKGKYSQEDVSTRFVRLIDEVLEERVNKILN